MSLVDLWTRLETITTEASIPDATTRVPPHLTWARSHPFGAALPDLPADYSAFIDALGGYPMFGLGYYDRQGFSFLPPSAMGAISVNLPDADDNWPKANPDGPIVCPQAFFAGYDLSDIEGWSFGPDANGDMVVWGVEGGMPREVLGAFTPWMTGLLTDAIARFSNADADQIEVWREAVEAESDPHRLYDYSIEGDPIPARSAADRALHWVCKQSGRPYAHGLIHDDGTWRIPMCRRFLRVRPVSGGKAQVIIAGDGASYAGPWTEIDV